eukprot:jgi/Bigna1/91202/estExt_fgenesh1_pg.C_920060
MEKGKGTDSLNKMLGILKRAGIGAGEVLDGMFKSKSTVDEGEAGGLHPGCQLGPDVTAKKSKIKMPPSIPITSLLNTIQYIALFYNFKSSKKVGELVKEIFDNVKGTYDYRGVSQALKPLQLRMAGKKDDHENLLKLLVNWISVQESPDEFNRMTDFVGYPTLNPNSPCYGEYSFLYVFLKEQAESSTENLRIIATDTVKRICALPQVMRINPKVASNFLLAYVHLLNSLSSLFGPLGTQQLCEFMQCQKVIHNLQQFYFWPTPMGNYVEDLLVRMEKEVMFPMCSLWESFQLEANSARSREKSAKFAESESIVYHIMDEVCSASKVFSHICEIKQEDGKYNHRNRYKTSEISTRALALLILHTINRDIEVTRKDIDNFLNLSEDYVRKISEEILQFGRDMYKKALDTKESKTLGQNYLNNYSNDVQDLYNIVDKKKMLSLPSLCHKALRQKLNYEFLTEEQRKFSMETEVLPPQTEFNVPLRSIITGHTKETGKKNKTVLRLMLSGGDEVMHSFLCAYVTLKTSDKTDLMKKVDIKIYVTPVKAENSIACFIARHDSWYYRNVYTPLSNDLFLLPWVRLHGNAGSGMRGMESQLHGTRMKEYYLGLLENYIRHANCTLKINVWNAKLYVSKPDWDHKADSKEALKRITIVGETSSAINAEPTHVIPFFHRLEIGYAAELAKYMASEGVSYKPNCDPDSRGALEMKKLEEKFIREKKFQPVEVQIRIARVGLGGKVIDVIHEQKYIAFHTLVLSNVPSTADNKSFPPNPEDPWLEMYARTASSSSAKKSLLDKEPHQHVCRLELRVKNDDQFSVLVDGVLFPKKSESTKSKTSGLGYRTIVVERLVEDDTGVPFIFPSNVDLRNKKSIRAYMRYQNCTVSNEPVDISIFRALD